MRRVSGAPPSRLRRNVLSARLRRVGWRIAIPVVVAAAICGGVRLGLSRAGHADWQSVEARLIDLTAAVGLKIADIRVEGRETTDRETILAALGAALGTPIMAVDPLRARQQLEALPWVSSAEIERRLPDTLIVRLVERKPLALWQHNGKLDLIDRTGSVIPVAQLDRFAKLPMVVGEDAAARAPELLAMLATEPDLAARVTAAIRVAGRRWNLRIDNMIDVLLPADQTAGAWAELAHVERSSAILKRDVRAVDMRLPDRLVVRVAPAAPIAAPAAKRARPSAKST